MTRGEFGQRQDGHSVCLRRSDADRVPADPEWIDELADGRGSGAVGEADDVAGTGKRRPDARVARDGVSDGISESTRRAPELASQVVSRAPELQLERPRRCLL
jgi:hypothetical protein